MFLIEKRMQKNNTKLAWHFSTGRPYSNKTRGVDVVKDPVTGEITIYARLYKTYIAKIERGQLYITHGGWPTATTTKAIDACLPVGWRYTRRQLIGPNGICVNVDSNWVRVDAGPSKYLVV